MLDSQSRLPAHKAGEWEESTFTRPMRSPFAESAPRPVVRSEPPAAVDVSIEEHALFDAPAEQSGVRSSEPPARPRTESVALRRLPTTPPPQTRPSRLPPPRFDAEATTRHAVPSGLLDAMRGERDSVRLRQAVRAAAPIDLSKTTEEPTLGAEVRLEVTGPRRAKKP